MRTQLGGLFLLFLAANSGLSQGPQKNGDPGMPVQVFVVTDFSALEAHGLKMRSCSPLELIRTESGQFRGRAVYVLEFQKDVFGYDLDAVQRACGRLKHVLLDDEKISIDGDAMYVYRIQGDISGVKGEAFRVVFLFGNALEQDPRLTIQQARRLAVRVK